MYAIKATCITIQISYCSDAEVNNFSMQNRVFQKYSYGTVTHAQVETSITQTSVSNDHHFIVLPNEIDMNWFSFKSSPVL